MPENGGMPAFPGQSDGSTVPGVPPEMNGMPGAGTDLPALEDGEIPDTESTGGRPPMMPGGSEGGMFPGGNSESFPEDSGSEGEMSQFPGSGQSSFPGRAGGMRNDPFEEIRNAINALEDEAAKENLNTLMDNFTSALRSSRSEEADTTALSDAEAALNSALAEAGIDLKVGKPEGRPQQSAAEGRTAVAPEGEPPAEEGTAPEAPADTNTPEGEPAESPEQNDVNLFRRFLKWFSELKNGTEDQQAA